MTIRPELIEELLKDYQNPEDLMGEGGILKELTKALVEKCLTAEIDTHLQENKTESKNRRNGHSKKKIKGEFGETEISVPRDRQGKFEPVIVRKGQTRFDGFDDFMQSSLVRTGSSTEVTVIMAVALQSDTQGGFVLSDNEIGEKPLTDENPNQLRYCNLVGWFRDRWLYMAVEL